MLIQDSYLLASSQIFELKAEQEMTVDLELTKAPPCFDTLLIGRVLHENMPVKNAVVKIFDWDYNPLFHAITNSRGVYRFKNILAPGVYKVIAAADGYQTSRTFKIKIKENDVVKMSIQLKECSISSNSIIYGKVREAGSKKPVEGAHIYMRNDCGIAYKTASNRDGQYILYDVRPEKYELIVKKYGYLSSSPLEVNVDRGDRIMLYVDLQKLCNRYDKTISGVLISEDDPVPDVPVFLYQLGDEGYETIEKLQVTNGDGVFLFSDLSEGTYILKGKLQSIDR